MDTFIILYSKFSEVSKNFINYILKNSRIKFKFLCLDFITVREKIVEIMGINELPCVIIIRNEQIEIYSGKDAYKLSEEMSRQELELKSELPKEKVNNTRLNKSSATIGGDRSAAGVYEVEGGRRSVEEGIKSNGSRSPPGNGRTILYDISGGDSRRSASDDRGADSTKGRVSRGSAVGDRFSGAVGDLESEDMMELISETERQSYVNSTIQDKNKNIGKRPLVGIRKNAGNYEYDTKEFLAASEDGDEKIVTNGIKKKTTGKSSKSLVAIATEMQKRREEFDLPRK